MRAATVAPADGRWTAFLETTRHDFYHLPGYVQLEADAVGGEALAVLVDDPRASLLLPLVLRPIAGSRLDAVSPYGYPGPLVQGAADPSFLGQALLEVEEALRRVGAISLFVRSHPLLGGALPESAGVVVRHGQTVSIDLGQPDAVLAGQLRRDHRRDIERGRRAGRQARWDEEWQHLDSFCAIYRETMDRVGAEASYFFDDSYFRRLREALGDRLRLCVLEIEGAIAAAGLFVETCGIVQYHLSGTAGPYLGERPAKLMIDFVRRWAKERGDWRLHLGGGVGGRNDSLFLFKAGFAPDRHEYATLRAILDEAEYARLCVAAGETVDMTGFFPNYRAARP